jgi:hypothetical protein
MEDLLALHEKPLYLPGTNKVDPSRPKVALSKLVNTAAVQSFFACALYHLFGPACSAVSDFGFPDL